MKQLELLEQELAMVQENIIRVKEYVKEQKYLDEISKSNYKTYRYNSLVVGELKHRLTALKQRITLVGKISTHGLFE